MAVFLNEEEIGSDAVLVGFPHLVLCGGIVVLMDNGTLVGAHVSGANMETAVLYALRRKAVQVGGQMKRFYLISDLRVHLGYGMKDVMGKAKAIGFSGPGYVVDLGVLKPTDGTYAQVTTNGGAAEATVRVRLNQDMKYTSGVGQPVYKIGKAKFGNPGSSTRCNQKTSTITTAVVEHNQDLLTPFVQHVQIA